MTKDEIIQRLEDIARIRNQEMNETAIKHGWKIIPFQPWQHYSEDFKNALKRESILQDLKSARKLK